SRISRRTRPPWRSLRPTGISTRADALASRSRPPHCPRRTATNTSYVIQELADHEKRRSARQPQLLRPMPRYDSVLLKARPNSSTPWRGLKSSTCSKPSATFSFARRLVFQAISLRLSLTTPGKVLVRLCEGTTY